MNITAHLSHWRRTLHRFPELGWTEFYATALICGELKNLGFCVHMGADAIWPERRLGVPPQDQLDAARRRALEHGADPGLVAAMGGGLTGLWADLDSGVPGPTLALRVDLDALALSEAQDDEHYPARLGFASQNFGLMHACGHDGHVALALGLAHTLAPLLQRGETPAGTAFAANDATVPMTVSMTVTPRLCGRLRLIFQPAEEGVRGACALRGALEGVTHLLGLHLGLSADSTGMVICSAEDFLATSKFNVVFHPAEPQGNPLLAACAATLGLHDIPRHGEAVTRINVGRLHASGSSAIPPAQADLRLETRAQNSGADAWMCAAMRRIVHAAAQMWQCAPDITLRGQAGSAVGTPALARRIKAAAHQLSGFTHIMEHAPFGASEDCATLLSQVQAQGGEAAYLLLGANLAAGHHNSRFDFDEAALPLGLELLRVLALDILEA